MQGGEKKRERGGEKARGMCGKTLQTYTAAGVIGVSHASKLKSWETG